MADAVADRRVRRVFLHIGAPKTGTTYLQALVRKNRLALHDAGIFLPAGRQSGQFLLGQELRKEMPQLTTATPQHSALLDRALARFDRSGCETMLMTSEELASMTAPQIEHARQRFAPHEVHVIYGVRDFAGLLTSSWQERVKNAERRQFEPWLEMISERRPGDVFWADRDVVAVLDRWTSDTPGHVHVLTLPTSGSEKTLLWNRFVGILGYAGRSSTRAERPNESLGFVEASVLAMVQQRIPGGLGPRRRDIVKRVVANQVLAARPDGVPILIPDKHRGWIVEESARRISYLQSTSLDVVGDLGELADADRRFGEVALEEHYPEAVDAAVDVIAALVGHIAAEKTRNDRHRRRLKGLETTRLGLHDLADALRSLRFERWRRSSKVRG